MLKNEWYTPEWLVKRVHNILQGPPDLDPASSLEANELIRAKRIYTIEDDGLSQPWYGNVYCNPPYSGSGVMDRWVDNALNEFRIRDDCNIPMLTNASVGTGWFNKLWWSAAGIALFHKRIKFWGLNSSSQPRQPNAMWLMTDDRDMLLRFDRELSDVAHVIMTSHAQLINAAHIYNQLIDQLSSNNNQEPGVAP